MSWSIIGQSPPVEAELTMRFTGTTCGDPCAPVAVIVTWPTYVPGLRPVIDALTERFCGAVPFMGETASHDASLEAEKLSEPIPAFDTDTVDGDGSDPPAAAAMVSELGVADRTGPVAVTLA
jgi:hypothetical protein